MKTKVKKETTLSVLQDIRDMMREHWGEDKKPRSVGEKIVKDWQDAHFDVINLADKPLPLNVPEVPNGHFLIYIPSLTMKEIVEEADDKASDGKPLVYNISWYKDEKFYTEELTRAGWYVVSERLFGKNKNWGEQETEIKNLKGKRLNAAEELYIQYAYEKVNGKKLTHGDHVKNDSPYNWEYAWTSSLSSYGYVVHVGGFGADGVFVADAYPVLRHADLGFRLSRRCS